jgi:hypothetical protein
MIRASRLALAGVVTVTVATAATLPLTAATLPFTVAHRIEVAGGSPISALAFAADGKRAYSAVGDELRSFDVATGAPGAVVRVPGQIVALAAAAGDAGGTLYAAVVAPARLLVLGAHPLRILSAIALRGAAPSGLLYQPGEHALYLESRAGHSVARLHPGDGKTIAVARLRGGLAQMAGDGRGTLYIANPAGDAIDVVATDKMTSTGAIPTPNCHAPTGIDFDPVGRRLFVACGNGTALVIDTDMGFAFEQLPIDKGTALRTVFTFHPGGPGGWKGGAFIAGDAPALDGIRMNAFISYTRGGSMPLTGRATALAVSPDGGQLWIGLAPRGGEPGPVEILALGARGGVQ